MQKSNRCPALLAPPPSHGPRSSVGAAGSAARTSMRSCARSAGGGAQSKHRRISTPKQCAHHSVGPAPAARCGRRSPSRWPATARRPRSPRSSSQGAGRYRAAGRCSSPPFRRRRPARRRRSRRHRRPAAAAPTGPQSSGCSSASAGWWGTGGLAAGPTRGQSPPPAEPASEHTRDREPGGSDGVVVVSVSVCF